MKNRVLIDGVVCDPEYVDPAIHKFIGMFRPPLDSTSQKYFETNSGLGLSFGYALYMGVREGDRERYNAGTYDLPQYVTI